MNYKFLGYTGGSRVDWSWPKNPTSNYYLPTFSRSSFFDLIIIIYYSLDLPTSRKLISISTTDSYLDTRYSYLIIII